MIVELIEKISNNITPTSTELKEAFDEVFSGLADENLSSSFLTALKVKNETDEDICAAITSSQGAISKKTLTKNYENLAENFCLKKVEGFFDINCAMDIICSANGLGALKYCFDSPFYANTSFETMKSLGANFDFNDEILNEKFEQTNFCYLKLNTKEPYFKYTNTIKRQLNFDNLLTITDKFLNPYGAKNQIICVKNNEMVEKIANACLKLNNSNSLIISSSDDSPFISPENNTYIAEAWKNKIFTYNLSFELIGLQKHSLGDIKVSSSKESAELIIKIFKHKEKNAIYDYIIANCALCLYITKKANSIIEGINLAKATIANNSAYEKLEQILKIYS